MADTFTPVSGYLAGIYRSLGTVVGAVEKHQLLVDGDFATGALAPNWDDDSVAASTAVPTALKGWDERSTGLVLNDDGTNLAGVSQLVAFDTKITAAQALTHRIIVSCWARFDAASDEATLKVTLQDAAHASLGTASVTMISAHPFYDDGTGYGCDGYFSVAIDAVADTEEIDVEIYSNAAAAQIVNISNVQLAIVEQVAGAFGQVAMPIGHDLEESTTFATADDGFRSYATTLIKQGALTFPSFWVQEESMAHEQSTEDELYVVLWTQKATNTSDRFEFLGKVSGIEWAAPVGELQKGSVTIIANGLIGYAHI